MEKVLLPDSRQFLRLPSFLEARVGAVNGATSDDDDDKTLHELLAFPILLIDRIRNSAKEADSSKLQCIEIVKQVYSLSQMLGSTNRLIAEIPTKSLYERPVRRIVSDVSRNLDRALTLVNRCRHGGLLKQVLSVSTSSDFKKISNLLEASIGDMKWLLEIFNCEGNNLTLPPIASSNDPTLAMVWSSIASFMMGRQLTNRIDSVNYLTLLAELNDRNKKLIVEEGAIPPLLKMLKEGGGVGSPEAQIAAAKALEALVSNVERTRKVGSKLGISVIVQALGNSPMKVQIAVAALVARMAEVDEKARYEFGNEDVMSPIISCLMMDLDLDDRIQISVGKNNIHSIVQDQINKGLVKRTLIDHTYHKIPSSSSFSSLNGSIKKVRENEAFEVKHELKVKCSLALWRLCRRSLLNSRKIAEGKGLQCLSKIIETETEELQLYCLLTLMEIAEVAEINTDFRKSAWKPSSPSVKGILDQLLRVMKEESNPDFQIPAVKTVGYLARTFSAKETKVISALVTQLGNKNVDVAIEAAIALGKFVCPENYNSDDHSRAIIEFNGARLLMNMLRGNNDRSKRHGLVLLCYLSLNAGNVKALEEAKAFDYLESSSGRSVAALNPGSKELYFKALHHLKLYQMVSVMSLSDFDE